MQLYGILRDNVEVHVQNLNNMCRINVYHCAENIFINSDVLKNTNIENTQRLTLFHDLTLDKSNSSYFRLDDDNKTMLLP